ncbi:MAG: hypothetical protein IPN42_05980 [Methylococcaceae bacterium]|nr:hypothetical protein [Methylococcaceae bacterium]
MKNLKIILPVSIITALAVIAFFLSNNVSVKDTPVAQSETVQEQGGTTNILNQKSGRYDPAVTENSFSVKNVLNEEQGSLKVTEEAVVEKGKNYLLLQVDNRIKQLRPFRKRIENIDDLKESVRNNLLSELTHQIDRFEAFKPEIKISKTKKDVRQVADKIKDVWIKSRLSVDHAEESVLVSKESHLVSEAGAASISIQKRIDAIKATGKDASSYEKLLVAYNNKIASAKQDVASAKEKYNAATVTSIEVEKENLIKEKNLSLASAQNNIKDAYKLLRDGAQQEFSQRFK